MTVVSTTDGRTPVRVLKNVAASATDSSVVAAIAGRAIRVVGVALAPGGTATNVTFNTKGSGAGTAISCLFALGANIPIVMDAAGAGWFQTAVGEALTVTTGTGATTGIQIIYVVV